MKDTEFSSKINELETLLNGNRETEDTKLEEAKVAARKSCLAVLRSVGQIAFSAWMVMFAVALLGFPLAYLTCLLATYAVVCVISSGISPLVHAILVRK